ncbi:MAG TPA: gliding motility-associated ABC transporter ATP-binding subunit GldA [Saprospiraceae bacterium]|nr:gliding motility-associated ABC transporter ATP-binding subunit GldA [Saprospiraceae bacterium]HMQ84296.1 gliding motility-associated ABC transporter ATP-binding subunit GldA [Saprospiraceae bacterium]
MSVKVEALTKIYGVQKAVNDISFEARPGEVLGFLGPNGAGKTTTMKIITCFLPQSSGQVAVCGYDVEKESMEVRRQIGYLPEHNPLYKDLYVKEYLSFVAKLHHIANIPQRVAEMIEMTGLGREQHKQIGALSKGYRQRVGLAQAMLHDPQVLILDEPTSGLDPNQLADIRKLIKDLGKKKTVIFSTHIMQEVKAICDRAIIINKGKLVADDSIENLQTKSSGEAMVAVTFLNDVSEGDLKKLPHIKAIKNLGERHFQIISDKQYDLRPDVFDFAVEKGNKILEMRLETYDIDEVFQLLTKAEAS